MLFKKGRLLLCALAHSLLLIHGSTQAKLYGYSQLVRDSSGTEVDLLYDVHVNAQGISLQEIYRLPYGEVKNKFFPTEQRVLDALERLSTQEAVDVIWESWNDDGWNPQFIAFGPLFIKDFFSRLNFIASDTWRHSVKRSAGALDKEFLSASFKSKIIAYSGYDAWVNYKQLYDEVIAQARSYFRPLLGRIMFPVYSDTPAAQLFKDDRYHRIADVEMLSHILASSKKKIVLYAGGWHCANIAEFLQKNGFRLVEKKVNSNILQEIQPLWLHRLDAGLLKRYPSPDRRLAVGPLAISPVRPIEPYRPYFGSEPIRPAAPVLYGEPKRAEPARPLFAVPVPKPAAYVPPAPVVPVAPKPFIGAPVGTGTVAPRLITTYVTPAPARPLTHTPLARPAVRSGAKKTVMSKKTVRAFVARKIAAPVRRPAVKVPSKKVVRAVAVVVRRAHKAAPKKPVRRPAAKKATPKRLPAVKKRAAAARPGAKKPLRKIKAPVRS